MKALNAFLARLLVCAFAFASSKAGAGSLARLATNLNELAASTRAGLGCRERPPTGHLLLCQFVCSEIKTAPAEVARAETNSHLNGTLIARCLFCISPSARVAEKGAERLAARLARRRGTCHQFGAHHENNKSFALQSLERWMGRRRRRGSKAAAKWMAEEAAHQVALR